MGRQMLIDRCEELGYTPDWLAKKLAVSPRTIMRLFAGTTKLRTGKRPLLAQLLDWEPEKLTAVLKDGVAPVLDDGWWSAYSMFEQKATSVRAYEPVLVPGLLQTRDYAAALLDNEEFVERRLSRQALITRADHPVPLVAILDESILHRPIGGPSVLADQLRHLRLVSERPNITIRVLPFDAPAQPAYWGALVILRFPWLGGLVYLEHTQGDHSLSSAHDVGLHEETFHRIESLALPVDASVDLIRTTEETYQ